MRAALSNEAYLGLGRDGDLGEDEDEDEDDAEGLERELERELEERERELLEEQDYERDEDREEDDDDDDDDEVPSCLNWLTWKLLFFSSLLIFADRMMMSWTPRTSTESAIATATTWKMRRQRRSTTTCTSCGDRP